MPQEKAKEPVTDSQLIRALVSSPPAAIVAAEPEQMVSRFQLVKYRYFEYN